MDFVMIEKQDQGITANNWDFAIKHLVATDHDTDGSYSYAGHHHHLLGSETDRFTKGLVDDLLNIVEDLVAVIIVNPTPFRYSHGGDACSCAIL
jgi:hypothetical protein